MAPEVVKGGDAGHDFVSLDFKSKEFRFFFLDIRRSIGGVLVFLHSNF
jgi:hypothetical protein